MSLSLLTFLKMAILFSNERTSLTSTCGNLKKILEANLRTTNGKFCNVMCMRNILVNIEIPANTMGVKHF